MAAITGSAASLRVAGPTALRQGGAAAAPRGVSVTGPRRRSLRVVASAAGSASMGSEPEDPYKVLGLTPLDSFEQVKVAHRKRVKDAEAKGDEATLERVDRAYDRIMMQQLSRRKQGLTFGSMKVSQDIKYADSDDWFPWRPRYEKSDKKTITQNAFVTAALAIWMVASQYTDYKVLQILLAYYFFRLFIKLDAFFPQKPEDEEKKWARNGRKLIRALSLVFGVLTVASVAHSAAYYGFSLFGYYVPRALLQFQELLITLACCIGMFSIGSFYR